MTVKEKRKACTAVLKENFKIFCEIIEELPEDKLSSDVFIELVSTIDAIMLEKLAKILGQNEQQIVYKLLKYAADNKEHTAIFAELGFVAKQEKEGDKDE